jgi:hypothetical protein
LTRRNAAALPSRVALVPGFALPAVGRLSCAKAPAFLCDAGCDSNPCRLLPIFFASDLTPALFEVCRPPALVLAIEFLPGKPEQVEYHFPFRTNVG